MKHFVMQATKQVWSQSQKQLAVFEFKDLVREMEKEKSKYGLKKTNQTHVEHKLYMLWQHAYIHRREEEIHCT